MNTIKKGRQERTAETCVRDVEQKKNSEIAPKIQRNMYTCIHIPTLLQVNKRTSNQPVPAMNDTLHGIALAKLEVQTMGSNGAWEHGANLPITCI